MKSTTSPTARNAQRPAPIGGLTTESSLRDASPDAVVVLSGTGCVCEWNAAAEAMLGYRREHAVGHDIESLIALGPHRVLLDDLARYAALGRSEFVGQIREMPVVRGDGLEMTVEVVVLPVPGTDPTDFLLQLRDVTARKLEMATYVDFYAKMQSFHEGAARSMAALTHELDLARTIQTAALPVRAPIVPGWDVAARYEFAREVGGDFYLFLTPAGHLDVVVGDVAGKGIPAALTSTSISHLLPWMRKVRSPREALADLNDALRERLPRESFVTLLLAEIDLQTNTVDEWNAGHPSALRFLARKRQVLSSYARGPFLGVMGDWDCAPDSWNMEPNDVLVLYTDGILETRCGGEEFGEERCADALRRHANESAPAIAEAMLREVKLWGKPNDDMTVVVCKRLG